MSKIRTRGISLVRTEERFPEPNRKESVMVKVQYMARCNASIPPSHKDFQNQYLPENYEAPRLPAPVKKGGKGNKPGNKLQKHKNNYLV